MRVGCLNICFRFLFYFILKPIAVCSCRRLSYNISLWSRPCVPHYVLQGMHLGRTTGLTGAEGEPCRNLQDAVRCPPSQYTSSNSDQIYQQFISQFPKPFEIHRNNLSGWPASEMPVSLRHT